MCPQVNPVPQEPADQALAARLAQFCQMLGDGFLYQRS